MCILIIGLLQLTTIYLFICFFKINYPSKKYQNEERSLKNLAIIIMIIIIMTDSDNYYIKKFNKF